MVRRLLRFELVLAFLETARGKRKKADCRQMQADLLHLPSVKPRRGSSNKENDVRRENLANVR